MEPLSRGGVDPSRPTAGELERLPPVLRSGPSLVPFLLMAGNQSEPFNARATQNSSSVSSTSCLMEAGGGVVSGRGGIGTGIETTYGHGENRLVNPGNERPPVVQDLFSEGIDLQGQSNSIDVQEATSGFGGS
jgi:hypothetical protein